MEFSWSALWNITDETPDNCEMFLNFNGMKLFLDCLKVASSPEASLTPHLAALLSPGPPATPLPMVPMEGQWGPTHRPASPGFAANRSSRGLP